MAVLCAALAGCGMGAQKQAAAGVAQFLAAVQTGDRVAFEAAVDRASVREDLRRQMVGMAKANGLEVEGGPSDLTLDRMIAPAVFHLAGPDGQPLAQPPAAAQLGPMIRLLDGQHACLLAAGHCQLMFGRSPQGWRLTAMPPPEVTVVIAPGP